MTANFIGLQMENGDIKTNSSKRKEIEFSERLLGVSFNDISKTLLQDDVYHYKVILTTEALRIAVELTVRTKVTKRQDFFSFIQYCCTYYLKKIVQVRVTFALTWGSVQQ